MKELKSAIDSYVNRDKLDDKYPLNKILMDLRKCGKDEIEDIKSYVTEDGSSSDEMIHIARACDALTKAIPTSSITAASTGVLSYLLSSSVLLALGTGGGVFMLVTIGLCANRLTFIEDREAKKKSRFNEIFSQTDSKITLFSQQDSTKMRAFHSTNNIESLTLK